MLFSGRQVIEERLFFLICVEKAGHAGELSQVNSVVFETFPFCGLDVGLSNLLLVVHFILRALFEGGDQQMGWGVPGV